MAALALQPLPIEPDEPAEACAGGSPDRIEWKRHGSARWAQKRLDHYAAAKDEADRVLGTDRLGRIEGMPLLSEDQAREVLRMIADCATWGGPDDHDDVATRRTQYRQRRAFIDSLPGDWPKRMHELHEVAGRRAAANATIEGA